MVPSLKTVGDTQLLAQPESVADPPSGFLVEWNERREINKY